MALRSSSINLLFEPKKPSVDGALPVVATLKVLIDDDGISGYLFVVVMAPKKLLNEVARRGTYLKIQSFMMELYRAGFSYKEASFIMRKTLWAIDEAGADCVSVKGEPAARKAFRFPLDDILQTAGQKGLQGYSDIERRLDRFRILQKFLAPRQREEIRGDCADLIEEMLESEQSSVYVYVELLKHHISVILESRQHALFRWLRRLTNRSV